MARPIPNPDEVLQRKAKPLAESYGDPQITELVNRFNAKYLTWEKVSAISRDEGKDPEIVWTRVKWSRAGMLRPIPLPAREGRTLAFTEPDIVRRELHLADQQLSGILTTDDEQPLSDDHKRSFIIGSLMDEAISSSQIEGASTSHMVAKEMLRTAREPRNNPERMIVNNYRAIRYMRDRVREDLSPDLLLKLQSIVTDRTLKNPDHSGRLRRGDDVVEVVSDQTNEVVHTPPPAEELPHRLQKLCDFANSTTDADDTGPFIHPVVRAAALHYQIGFDHPFCDGNGRTARVIFLWSLLRQGYWLIEFLPVSRLILNSNAQYGHAYLHTETDGYDFTYFLVYIARVLGLARREFKQRLEQQRQDSLAARRVFSADDRLNYRQRDLLLHALRHPGAVYTVEGHEDSHQVSYNTARTDLMALAEMGYLRSSRPGKKIEFIATNKTLGHDSDAPSKR